MAIDYRNDAKWTVYVHISPSNKYYVGITKLRPIERWGTQGQMYKKQLFYNAIQKYGWDNFEHVIIAEHLTKDEACKMEMTLIESLDSYGEHGYNGDSGGTYEYKERKNVCGEKIGHVTVETLLGINKYGLYEYNCLCDCGNYVVLDQQQLLYSKKYICCKECEKKMRHNDNIKTFTPNTKVSIMDNYLEVRVGENIILCDKKYYELMSDSSLIFEYNEDNTIKRIKLHSPRLGIKCKTLSTILFKSNENKNTPIFKNFNNLDFRSSNVVFVPCQVFTAFHHLYNNRFSNTYLIISKTNKNGQTIFKPSNSLYRNTGIRIKSTTSLEEAIKIRNELIQEKYKDVEVLQTVISLFYCNKKEVA